MSKIEKYNAAKAIAAKVRRAVLLCTGRNEKGELDRHNDKASIYVQFTGLQNSNWSPMTFQIQASHGFYGSSSGYSDTSAELGGYLAIAIKAKAKELFDMAAELAQKDAETARQAAEDEARAILDAIA